MSAVTVPGRGVSSMSDIGERLASHAARFDIFEKYTHERWHELNNNLQALGRLPEQMARDIGKLEGKFNSEIRAIERAVERSVTAAVERAIEPINKDIKELKDKVEVLESGSNQITGAKQIFIWVIQTLLAAIVAMVALGKGQHP
jgi:archaellum component FlaC